MHEPRPDSVIVATARPLRARLSGLLARALVTIAPLCAGACGGDDDAAPAGPLEVADFCAAVAPPACARLSRCGCGAGVEGFAGACPAALEASCPVAPGTPLRDELDTGARPWDAEAARRLASGLGDAPCDAHPCAVAGCLGLAAEGGACADERIGCTGGARCVDGICVRPGADGAACAANGACASGRCAGGRCEAKAPLGGACAEDGECASGRCDFSTGRCGALIVDGELCTESSDCASGYCDRDLALGAGSCAPLRPDGAACDEDLACAGGACRDSRCAALACAIPG